jgi:predicted kinase
MAATTFKTPSEVLPSSAFAALGSLVRRASAAVERHNARSADRRARAELLTLASQYESLQPGVAAELRAAAQRS